MRRALVVFACLAVFGPLLPAEAWAQRTTSSLVSPAAAQQIGLERMWFAQVNLDRGRGRLSGVHQHVSATQAHTIFQITHGGKRFVFSERDRDAFGKELGVEGAQKRADEKLASIKADLEAAAAAKAAAPAAAQPAATAPAAAPAAPEIKLPPIETFIVPRITLYTTSQNGTLHAIDGETGQTRWTVAIGSTRFVTLEPGANDKYVAVVNGSTLYVVKADDGTIVWNRSLVGAPGAGPGVTDEYAYVPMLAGAVEAVLLDNPKKHTAVFRSFGRITVQPTVSVNSVAWPTDEGNLYVAMAHDAGVRFRVEAQGSISSAPAFLDPERVFATSLDGFIYCVNERRGNLLWRFTTGEPIGHSPVALLDQVFAITNRGTMFSVGVEDGQERWIASGIRSYVAGNASHLYVMDLRGNLVVLDTASGAKLGSLPLHDIDRPYLNATTDRLILATSTGLVQCLRQGNLPWPQLVNGTIPAQPATGETEPAAGATDPAVPMPVPGADPFGAPAAGAPAEPDPFAAPAAGGNKPAAPAADPFAP